MDLGELLRDEHTHLTPRWLLWLVEWLPHDSALRASIQGGSPFRGWTAGRYLAAGVVDLLAGGNWQRGGGKGKRPQPVQRPGQHRRRVMTVAQLNSADGR